jgi:hypothetical protein
MSHSLVKRRVFARQANSVINTGPKTGWKLDAWPKLKYVLPNQIWTISQAMALMLHVSDAAGLVFHTV